LGGKGVEVERKAGEDNRGRAHGLRTHGPWAECEDEKVRGFKPGEWDPNENLPKRRSAGRSNQ
jgi:hypothetical protein